MTFGHITNVGEFWLNDVFYAYIFFLFYCQCLDLIANDKYGQWLINELFACQLDYVN